jgi:ppGpp synthetase/RelA/SpoT-type nucleotidyltranferase
VNRASVPGLDALLNRPSAAVLPAPLRQALREHWEAPECDHQMRASWSVLGDTLDALAMLSADEGAVAALLFDLPGLRASLDQLPLGNHKAAVIGLLDGQDAADPVWALHAGREAGRNSEGLRRLLLAIIRDLRVVPILLARQLARMRAADKLDDEQRRALAQLTRDIHAPLANRLGIWQLKWELEDLAFRHLEPETYRRIAREVDETRIARERYVENVKKVLSRELVAQGIKAEVSGRPKHIYSIWRKMQKKRLAFDQLYDIRAVRVMVDDVAACYAALGVVHALWAPVPSEFDDYIARPKANDYRSLHTAVVGPEGRTIEVQIRTHEMHSQAELGVAAHWKYKEGGKGAEKSFDRKITWMRQLLEQAQDGQGNELAGALDAELTEDRVYALSPKDEVLDLPQGATPLDFAYQVHTMVGPPLPRRQGQRPHRAADLSPAQRRPRRDPDRQGGRPAPRLADAGQRLPGQQPLARKGAQLVPQAGPRAQRAGRARTARARAEAAGPAAFGSGGGEEVPCRQRRRPLHPGGAGRYRPEPGQPDAAGGGTPPASPRPRRPCRGRPRAARTWASPSSPCRAWATCWCSWHAAASRWPASRSSAT